MEAWDGRSAPVVDGLSEDDDDDDDDDDAARHGIVSVPPGRRAPHSPPAPARALSTKVDRHGGWREAKEKTESLSGGVVSRSTPRWAQVAVAVVQPFKLNSRVC